MFRNNIEILNFFVSVVFSLGLCWADFVQLSFASLMPTPDWWETFQPIMPRIEEDAYYSVVFFSAFSWPCIVRSISTFPLHLHNTARLRLPAITPHPQYNLSLSSVAPIWWKHRIHHRCRSSIFLLDVSFHTIRLAGVHFHGVAVSIFKSIVSFDPSRIVTIILIETNSFSRVSSVRCLIRCEDVNESNYWANVNNTHLLWDFRFFSLKYCLRGILPEETGSLICSILFGQLNRCISCSNYSNHQISTYIYALETHLFQFKCQVSV